MINIFVIGFFIFSLSWICAKMIHHFTRKLFTPDPDEIMKVEEFNKTAKEHGNNLGYEPYLIDLNRDHDLLSVYQFYNIGIDRFIEIFKIENECRAKVELNEYTLQIKKIENEQ